MKYPTRIYYTETDKAEMWDRWQKGESLNSIARQFGTSHSSIQGIFAPTGGIRPAERSRSRRVLTLPEREEISRGVAAGQSLRWIAASLARAPSTVSREINRNGGRRRYRANKADQAAWDRAHRAKTWKRLVPIQTELISPASQLAFTDTEILADLLVRHAILAGPSQGKAFELRAVALICLLRHGTPPSALLRTLKVSTKPG